MDRFSRFCTAYGRKYLYFTMGAPIHQNCRFPWGIWTSHVTRCFRPMQAHKPNSTSIGSAVFAQTTAECLYCLQWFAYFPLKIAPSHVGIWTSCNMWFIGPTRVRNANGNLIVSVIFAGLNSVCDTLTERQKERQTDHATRSDAA